ncbi:Bax inhibitor-1/YccA family protein [Demequina sp. NBRC 110053]|uniref:Bax inhibitor-1/YccA family protein n=1 Tax=Demequina sp. NBRC 110053 TaxID=1570342 RepID=UPI000A04DA69|nr:Bax inhibitor-1/YccA family protein [Demequina sp. NBRC 110053]
MASPVFSSNSAFKPGQTYDVNGTPVTEADLEQQYAMPSAGPVETGRMSYEGVITKASGMILLAFLTAIPGYMFFNFAGLMISAIAGMVLGLVLAFKKVTTPALALAYAAIEGYFLGSISTYIETAFDVPGAALQALLATACTFAVCLWLYKSGRVRYTPKMQKFLMIGGISYLLFSLVNIGLMIFGGTDSAWGLRTGVEIAGIPLGVLIGAFAVILGCVSLIGDFDFVENGVKNGLPQHFDWKAAFGIVVTLVWLYIEFLRIIAILQGRD